MRSKLNLHITRDNGREIIAAAQRSLAADWGSVTFLTGLRHLRVFLKTIEPHVPEINRRYELASEALAATARPQDWKTIRKLMTFRAHLSEDTMSRLTGSPHDVSGVVMRLKALDHAGQKAFVDKLFDGAVARQQEHWRQFIGIWSFRAIYPDKPTRENMTTARERLMRRHLNEVRKREKAKESGQQVGRDVQAGIRRLAKVWNEVPPLARLMFLQEQDRLDAEQEGGGDK